MEERSRRANTFWDRASAWAQLPFIERKVKVVSFRHHLFPCFQHAQEAVLFLHRSCCKGQTRLEISVEESSGGAKSGRDFLCGLHVVTFQENQDEAVLRIPITYHKAGF